MTMMQLCMHSNEQIQLENTDKMHIDKYTNIHIWLSTDIQAQKVYTYTPIQIHKYIEIYESTHIQMRW